MPEPPRNARRSDLSLMKYATMGIQMLVIMALFTFGGYYLDHGLGLGFPVFTLVLSIVGIAAAFYLSLRDFIRTDKIDRDK